MKIWNFFSVKSIWVFEEFEYICQLINQVNAQRSCKPISICVPLSGAAILSIYLKMPRLPQDPTHDLPIEEIRDMLEVVIYIRQHGIGNLSITQNRLSKNFGERLKTRYMVWKWPKNPQYHPFSLPIEHRHLITEKILQQEVYKTINIYMTCEWQSIKPFHHLLIQSRRKHV